MKRLARLLVLCLAFLSAASAYAEKITVAAASDLKFAMDDIVAAFNRTGQDDQVEVIYGSFGKFHTQLQQGVPYNVYFSADYGFVLSGESLSK